jgi:hypothetical protein
MERILMIISLSYWLDKESKKGLPKLLILTFNQKFGGVLETQRIFPVNISIQQNNDSMGGFG